jgi:uncharacterized protein
LVYKEQCGKCHVFRGEGIHIGPDLTGMSVQPKRDMLTYIIDPNRSVEGNYRVYTVVTVDGRIRSGLLASETGTSIEMFDAEGKRHVVLREDIDELVASTKSLMPEGFEKQVTEDQLSICWNTWRPAASSRPWICAKQPRSSPREACSPTRPVRPSG